MSKTLTQLRTMAREASDMESSDFISDSELNTYINQAAADLHDKKIASMEDYALTSAQFTLTTSSNSYSLPATFYNLKGLDYSDGGQWYRVPQFNFAERGMYREDTGFDGTYRIWYNATFTELSADGDTVEDRDHEYIVAYAARKCLQKEESDTREIDAWLGSLIARITRMRGKRDASGPRHVAEVRPDRSMRGLWSRDTVDADYSTSRAYRLLGSTLVVVARGLYPAR